MNFHDKPQTQEEIELVRERVAIQTRELISAIGYAQISCAICGRLNFVYNLTRCFFCGLWLCRGCGSEHFETTEARDVRHIAPGRKESDDAEL